LLAFFGHPVCGVMRSNLKKNRGSCLFRCDIPRKAKGSGRFDSIQRMMRAFFGVTSESGVKKGHQE
jgi:hypothetical protein